MTVPSPRCPRTIGGRSSADCEAVIVRHQPVQPLDCPEKYSLSLGAHLFGDVRVVDSVRGLVLCRENDLPPEEADAAVVQTLQCSVAKSDKADIQVSLIALLSLAL